MDKHTSRVFISYSNKDIAAVDRIKEHLQQAGFVTQDDRDVSLGSDFLAARRSLVSTSDYVILVLSPDAVASQWFRDELDYAVRTDWKQRGIVALPIMVRRCELPASLRTIAYVDGTKELSHAIDLLVERLRTYPALELEGIRPENLEKLTVALLQAYGFQSVIDVSGSGVRDYGIDFTARYETTDPFGRPQWEEWAVQVKATSRPDLTMLHNFLGAISLRKGQIGLLVTSGQFSSAAKAYLEHTERTGGPKVLVIEGDELKRLLVARQDLLHNFFKEIVGQEGGANA